MRKYGTNLKLLDKKIVFIYFLFLAAVVSYSALILDSTLYVKFFIGGIASMVAILALRNNWDNYQISSFDALLFLLLIILLIHLETSEYLSLALNEFNRFVVLIAVFVSFKLIRPVSFKRETALFFALIVMFATFSSVYQLITGWLDGNSMGLILPSGLSGNKNLNSHILSMGLLISIISLVKNHSTTRYIWLLNAVVSLFLIYFLKCRSAYVFSLVGLLGISVTYYFHSRSDQSKWLLGFCLILALFGLVYTNILEQFILSFEDSKSGFQSRFLLWEKSIEMFLNFPFSGEGSGAWRINHTLFGDNSVYNHDASVYYVMGHNDYLQNLLN
ncbi:MAG: hypothetical protein CL840_02260 [Crocinitomicaceae bacterium]|nr:hypothetical protein [Crocinitomicaceae bacterium]